MSSHNEDCVKVLLNHNARCDMLNADGHSQSYLAHLKDYARLLAEYNETELKTVVENTPTEDETDGTETDSPTQPKFRLRIFDSDETRPKQLYVRRIGQLTGASSNTTNAHPSGNLSGSGIEAEPVQSGTEHCQQTNGHV